MFQIVLPLWLVIVGIGVWATAKLALRVWKAGKEVGLLVEICTTLASAAATFCVFASVLGLRMIFVAVVSDGAEPHHRARALAEGISLAMNCTALALGVWIPSFIVLSVILRERKGRSR